MLAICYFSPGSNSRGLALLMAEKCAVPVYDITEERFRNNGKIPAEIIILVFPIYNQKAPPPVIDFVSEYRDKDFYLIATYGKMGTGDSLHSMQSLFHLHVLGGAYYPSNHTYRPQDKDYPKTDGLEPLISKIKNENSQAVILPPRQCSAFVDFFPKTRSKFSVSIKIDTDICTHCGLCRNHCPVGAINDNSKHPDPSKCLKCLRCARLCPNHAIKYRLNFFLRLYLKTIKDNTLYLYL